MEVLTETQNMAHQKAKEEHKLLNQTPLCFCTDHTLHCSMQSYRYLIFAAKSFYRSFLAAVLTQYMRMPLANHSLSLSTSHSNKNR